jgi:hypothetical protein
LAYGSIQIKYYSGWKNVVKTDGNESQDTMSFSSLESCPYQFSSAYNGTGWAALNSTLVYIKTGNESLAIDDILSGEKPITDIIGAWWRTDWEGMGTKPLQFPIIIPANQEAIIQLNHIITSNITFVKNTSYNTFYNNISCEQNLPQLSFKIINPTKLEIIIQNATQPFFIIFGENYNSQWKAYISSNFIEQNNVVNTHDNIKEDRNENSFTVQDISYLFNQPVSNQYHFIANGYANAWYIDPQQLNEGPNFTITLFFVLQAYDYVGVIVTVVTIIIVSAYLLLAFCKEKKRRKVNITSEGLNAFK